MLKYLIPLTALLFVGCNPKKEVIIESQPLPIITESLHNTTTKIISKSDDIVKSTKEQPTKISAIQIKELATVSLSDIKSLDDVQLKYKELIVNNEELKKEIVEKDSEIKTKTNKLLITAFGICIIGMMAGIALVFFKQIELGISVLLTSLISMGLIYFISTFAWLLAIISGTLFLGFLAYAGYVIYKKNDIVKELVSSFEKVKNKSQYTDKEKNEVLNIQSDDTINEVNEVKKQLKI